MGNFYQALGDRIKSRRNKSKLTQHEIARKLHISAQAVSKWERGENAPDIALLSDLAGILNVTVDRLLGNKLESYTKKIRLFADLTHSEKSLLISLFQGKPYKKGEYIYKEKSTQETGFYIVERGQVALLKGGKVLAKLNAGNYFSDYSALDGKNCVTSARVDVAGVIHCLSATKLDAFIREYPKVGIKLYQKAIRDAFKRLRKLE